MTHDQMVKAIRTIGSAVAGRLGAIWIENRLAEVTAANAVMVVLLQKDAEVIFEQMVKISMVCDEDDTSEEDTRAQLLRQLELQATPLIDQALASLEYIPEDFKDQFRGKTLDETIAAMRDYMDGE